MKAEQLSQRESKKRSKEIGEPDEEATLITYDGSLSPSLFDIAYSHFMSIMPRYKFRPPSGIDSALARLNLGRRCLTHCLPFL